MLRLGSGWSRFSGGVVRQMSLAGVILAAVRSGLCGAGSGGVAEAVEQEESVMLKGISPCLGPELLKTLAEMGHGDEIVLADAHFPACSLGPRVIRADGVSGVAMLDAVLSVLVLDRYVASPAVMMAPVPGDTLDADLVQAYWGLLRRHEGEEVSIAQIERYAFYERARQSYAIVVTGECAKYANILLKKGVVPVAG